MQEIRTQDIVTFDTKINASVNGSYKSKYAFAMLSDVFSTVGQIKRYSIKIAGGCIPNTVFNTNESNNTIYYSIAGGSSGTVTIIPGSYNANTFLSALISAFAAEGVTVSGSYSTIRQRFTLTNGEATDLTLDFTDARSAYMQVGYEQDTYVFVPAIATESSNVANVTGTESNFNIFINGVNGHITAGGDQKSSPLLWSATVPTTQPMSFIPLPTAGENQFVPYAGNRNTVMEIRDSSDILVNFQGVDYSIKFLIEEISLVPLPFIPTPLPLPLQQPTAPVEEERIPPEDTQEAV